MKRTRWLLVLVSFLSFALGFGQSKTDLIDRLMKAYYQNGVFNGVVLVSSNGQVIYHKAFGLADRELEVPMSTATKFKIASLSKPFTALTVMQLVSEGKLRLEGTIRDYIPDYQGPKGDSITIRQLLTHTSGIRSDLDPETEAVQERLYHSLRDWIRLSESNDLDFEPGTRFGYSNFGYSILACMIEAVTGKPFDQVLQEKTFGPSGMSQSNQYDNNLVVNQLAKGYEYRLLYGYRNTTFLDPSNTKGCGGLISTAEDLYRFDRILYTSQLIEQPYRDEIFKPSGTGNYGYGWFISKRLLPGTADSLLIADHAGSINGFGSYMARILTDSSCIIVLKNHRADTYIEPAYAPEIGNQIFSILYGESVELPKKSIANHIAALIGNEGIDAAISEYYRIVQHEACRFNLEESELNKLGIELLFRFDMPDEALEVFRVNMMQFPKSYNTYDSYAYTLKRKAEPLNAVLFYWKGLEALKNFPAANDLNATRRDAENAGLFICTTLWTTFGSFLVRF